MYVHVGHNYVMIFFTICPQNELMGSVMLIVLFCTLYWYMYDVMLTLLLCVCACVRVCMYVVCVRVCVYLSTRPLHRVTTAVPDLPPPLPISLGHYSGSNKFQH